MGLVHCRILSINPKLDLMRLSQLGRHAICPGFSNKQLQLFASERNRIRQYHEDGDVAMEGGSLSSSSLTLLWRSATCRSGLKQYGAVSVTRRLAGDVSQTRWLSEVLRVIETRQLGGDAHLLVRFLDVDLRPAEPVQSHGTRRAASGAGAQDAMSDGTRATAASTTTTEQKK